MPIYEYECSDCGDRVERLQRLNDPPPEPCGCGGTMRRQISAPAFQFKGSGWYVTDYGGRKAPADDDSSARASGKEEKPSSDKADKGSEKSSEKSAEKSADKAEKATQQAASGGVSTASKSD